MTDYQTCKMYCKGCSSSIPEQLSVLRAVEIQTSREDTFNSTIEDDVTTNAQFYYAVYHIP